MGILSKYSADSNKRACTIIFFGIFSKFLLKIRSNFLCNTTQKVLCNTLHDYSMYCTFIRVRRVIMHQIVFRSQIHICWIVASWVQFFQIFCKIQINIWKSGFNFLKIQLLLLVIISYNYIIHSNIFCQPFGYGCTNDKSLSFANEIDKFWQYMLTNLWSGI